MALTKQVLRKQMKEVLAKILSESRMQKSQAISQKVLQSDSYKNSNKIAVFLSMPEEVETIDIIKDIFKSNRICYVPSYDTKSRHMDMYKLDSMEDLQNLPRTKWNIQQPTAEDGRENPLETEGLDLILVPGLAFTNTGKRLGRGKGYYDTFLNRHITQLGKSPITMALAFKEQVIDEVPTHEHDYVIDIVVTDD